jgi:hypothetical protein
VPATPAAEVQNVVFVELYAPFLFHLAQHFFVGFGPEVYVDLFNSTESMSSATGSMSSRRMFCGLESTVGGWF